MASSLNRTPRYQGRIIHVDTEVVTLPNGHRFELEIVRHPGGAASVVLDDRGRVCLLRQYRHVAGQWLWELPAGKLEPGEPPLHTAKRELLEEAGVEAEQWQDLGVIYTSPGIYTEKIYLYLAKGLQAATLKHEEEELIEVQWLDFNEALAWAGDGTISDAKTIIGLFRVMPFI